MITETDLHEQAVRRALEVLHDVMEDDGVTSTEYRVEAARAMLNYDAEIYSTNAEILMNNDGEKDDEDDEGEDDGER